ncbi:hypothetical protein KL86PLE_100654 [uncultured Pleomorphomonas sp.]|uniref:Uncharacterized protein n=1 Tax=uncultured Pleomorphomonas sp. TaxID=442121 RepID=A0A212L599_9HYPH|nr:hypothetical protein KL86PLE_100654 [uncultured Pleomorphomonas sp.]
MSFSRESLGVRPKRTLASTIEGSVYGIVKVLAIRRFPLVLGRSIVWRVCLSLLRPLQIRPRVLKKSEGGRHPTLEILTISIAA